MKQIFPSLATATFFISLGWWLFEPNDSTRVCSHSGCNSGSSIALSAIILGIIFIAIPIYEALRKRRPVPSKSERPKYMGQTPYGSLQQYEHHLRKLGVAEEQIKAEVQKYSSGA
jgi:hypothetical protein